MIKFKQYLSENIFKNIKHYDSAKSSEKNKLKDSLEHHYDFDKDAYSKTAIKRYTSNGSTKLAKKDTNV